MISFTVPGKELDRLRDIEARAKTAGELWLRDVEGNPVKIGDTIEYMLKGQLVTRQVVWSEVNLCIMIGGEVFHEIPQPLKFKKTDIQLHTKQ